MEEKKLTKIISLIALAVLLGLVAAGFALRWSDWTLGLTQQGEGLWRATPAPESAATPIVESPVVLAPPRSAYAPPEGAVDVDESDWFSTGTRVIFGPQYRVQSSDASADQTEFSVVAAAIQRSDGSVVQPPHALLDDCDLTEDRLRELAAALLSAADLLAQWSQ